VAVDDDLSEPERYRVTFAAIDRLVGAPANERFSMVPAARRIGRRPGRLPGGAFTIMPLVWLSMAAVVLACVQ
jgi:hypothetical protein